MNLYKKKILLRIRKKVKKKLKIKITKKESNT